ncbi:hypothetical protein PG999_001863 [Apiospora kogelbergensis]|uniref:Uncharacterized protein n=1 Tax=Apiospora kogelbergensis TaxID=1337665 RepID=A0AAW0R6T8_9PEZI
MAWLPNLGSLDWHASYKMELGKKEDTPNRQDECYDMKRIAGVCYEFFYSAMKTPVFTQILRMSTSCRETSTTLRDSPFPDFWKESTSG